MKTHKHTMSLHSLPGELLPQVIPWTGLAGVRLSCKTLLECVDKLAKGVSIRLDVPSDPEHDRQAGLVALVRRLPLLTEITIHVHAGEGSQLDLHNLLVAGGIAPHITSLRLVGSSSSSSSSSIGNMWNAFRTLTGLRLLDLGSYPLQLSLSSLTTLTELRLESSGRYAATTGRAMRRMPHLCALDLGHSRLGRFWAVALAPSLSLLTQLTRLALDHCFPSGPTFGGAAIIAPSVGCLTNLVELDFSSNVLASEGSDALALALRGLPALRKLRLDHIKNVHDSLVRCLGELADLQELHLKEAGALPDFAGMSALEHLDISRVMPPALPDHTIVALAHLTRLDIRGIAWGQARRLEAVAPLLPRLSALRHLNLCDNSTSDTGGTLDVIGIFAPHLPLLPTLRHLDLSCSRLVITEVAVQMLSAMPHLTHLDLESCCLNDAKAAILMPALAAMTGLRHLNLRRNDHIGPEAMAAILMQRRHPMLNLQHE